MRCIAENPTSWSVDTKTAQCNSMTILWWLYIYHQGNSETLLNIQEKIQTHDNSWMFSRSSAASICLLAGVHHTKSCRRSAVRLSLSLAIWRVVVFVNESCPCASTPCARLICSWLTEPGPPDTRETDETATTSPESLQNQIWKLFRASVPGTVTSPGPRLLDEMGCTPCHVCACLRGESRLSWLGLNE